jgi:hypothetical protein
MVQPSKYRKQQQPSKSRKNSSLSFIYQSGYIQGYVGLKPLTKPFFTHPNSPLKMCNRSEIAEIYQQKSR